MQTGRTLNTFGDDDPRYYYMHKIPPKSGRYIVFDTETTGLGDSDDHVVEIGAHEIMNGKLTGEQFHLYIRPRKNMPKEVVEIHKISNDFYDNYFKDLYSSDETNMQNFLKFIGNQSLLLAHNAPFDMQMINKELKHWGLRQIQPLRFRCTMRIFHDMYGRVNPGAARFKRLSECCEIVGLKAQDESYHNALYDAEMTAKLMCKLFEILDTNPILMNDKELNYARNTLDNYNIRNVKNVMEENSMKNSSLSKGKEQEINTLNSFPNISTNQQSSTETNKTLLKSKTKNLPPIDSVTSANSHKEGTRSKSGSTNGNFEQTENENYNSDEAKEFSQEDLDDLLKELS